MTYRTRGRSIIEVIVVRRGESEANVGNTLKESVYQAATFVGFLTGFVMVLCIGNYYRAKRAMERQRQRRLAKKLGNRNGMLVEDSPKSHASSEYSDEKQSLLRRTPKQPPEPKAKQRRPQPQQQPQQKQPLVSEDLLLHIEEKEEEANDKYKPNQ
eukprot:CAMPEP_0116842912 /NCGR_PEP_ID=MMETSP0418-20121206/11787_1 /TAXON_ID=1158023 /ORGANISM="Astrosyne radiata, Strain 13vi08-1A" /LENGTH=155 /DNA_ID=CAMNT_0004473589 /DNA_START=28 /DNA_END=495 /DNA_ORIENTATION=+